MDLSLRAYIAGWKAIYLREVTVLNEVTEMTHPPRHKHVHAFMRSCMHAAVGIRQGSHARGVSMHLPCVGQDVLCVKCKYGIVRR